jgi:hypothetical protein
MFLIEGCAGYMSQSKTETPMEFNSGTYRFTGVRKDAEKGIDDWQTIAQVLNRYGCNRCEDLEGKLEEIIGSTTTYSYEATISWTPPVTSNHLDQLHTDLLSLKLENVKIALEWASVDALYRGLTAAGKLRILVRIEVSKSSRLFVDKRVIIDKECVVGSGQSGDFVEVCLIGGEYNKEIMIRPKQEWIFYYTELDVGKSEPLRRYFRLNIITQQEEELSGEDFWKSLKETD